MVDRRIRDATLKRQESGVFPNGGGFQNGFADQLGRGAGIFDWNGKPEGYEGQLVCCWAFLHSMLVEVLLDAALIAENPERLDTYYRVLASVDPARVEAAVNCMAPLRPGHPQWFDRLPEHGEPDWRRTGRHVQARREPRTPGASFSRHAPTRERGVPTHAPTRECGVPTHAPARECGVPAHAPTRECGDPKGDSD